MKTYALLIDGSLKRIRQIDEANTELIQLADSKGYKEVVYPPKTDDQSYGTPYIENDVITFNIVDMSAQEIYEREHAEWLMQLNDYNELLPDATEWLIKALVQKGVLVPNDIPVKLKNYYQNKTQHRNNEPQQP
jgi:hypothetical protein